MKKWILRILVIFAVIGAFTLFGLKIVSGTSDSQKKGLEQAFSQLFQGNATFGTLKAFNLIPQFSIEIDNLQISGIKQTGKIEAEKLLVSFGPLDLVMKNRLIEEFHLTNLKISEGVYTPMAIALDDVGIYPNEKKDAAALTFNGHYGDKEIKGSFSMMMTSDIRPKFSFAEKNEFVMNLGAVQMSGLFSPYQEKTSEISRIKMFAQKKNGNIQCELADDRSIELSIFMQDIMAKIATIKSPDDLQKLCSNLKNDTAK